MELKRLQASESVPLRRLDRLGLLRLGTDRGILLLRWALLPIEDLGTPDSEVGGILQVHI